MATGRTHCDAADRIRERHHDPVAASGEPFVIRWLLVVFVALLLFNGARSWLEKIGLGRLPGDFRFRLFGREWFLPFASSVLLSLLAMLLIKLL